MTEEQTIKKVTKEKNPNRVAAGKKSYETPMIKLKEDILTNSSNTTSNTPSDTLVILVIPLSLLVIPLVILVMLVVILVTSVLLNHMLLICMVLEF